MKQLKRLLALLLTLALALSLALPAFASEEPNPAKPIITAQPQSVTVLDGEPFTLSVQAEIPNGDPLRYEWYEVGYGATGVAQAQYSGGWFLLSTNPFARARHSYYCVAYNANDDTIFVQSETAMVTVTKEPPAWMSSNPILLWIFEALQWLTDIFFDWLLFRN